jgi:hypothetical protein
LIGHHNQNPILNTRVYLASFPDGHIAEYSANLITEAIYNNVNDDGTDEFIFDAIIGHGKDETAINNTTITPTTWYTTKGWLLCISWRDGTSSWHTLADIKQSYPLELAQYASTNQLETKPAFSWWVKHTIKHRQASIKAVKRCYLKKTHKFGIRVPQTVEEAIQIDLDTKSHYWRDAIHKEMKNCRVAFKVLEEDEHVPIGTSLPGDT